MDWDLGSFFPSVEADEYRRFFAALDADVKALRAELAALAPLSASTRDAWRSAVERFEGLATRNAHLGTFIACLRAYDVADTQVARAEAQATTLDAEMSKLRVELLRALREAGDAEIDALATGELAPARFFLARLAREARFSMDAPLESLAADLGTDGISAWGRLYDTIAGKLELDMVYPDGRRERVPMAQRRSLMQDADRRVRRAAFDAGNAAWRSVSDTVAAAINHIAGTRLTLYARRGVGHFLDVALDQSCISRATLDAMFEAVDACAELPRRFLRLKARTMGLPRIGWYDLEAPLPLGKPPERIPWDKGKGLVRDAFGRSYPALAGYFDRAIAKRWVEHTPRRGKSPGAFCANSPLVNESRVFMTYQGSLGDVSTLAHEVGHGFHAHLLAGTRPLARRYPMTLAESASTFAELLLSDGLLAGEDVDDAGRAMLLGEALGDASIFLLDITVRYRFEKAFYERRASGEVPAEELEALMAATQREVFGDALEEGGEDPLFWASKMHFFITSVSFYNFPYTFGYLLSRGLRALHVAEGDAFLPRYERFLQRSGQGWAHEVARDTLGQDLESPAFWRASIESLAPALAQLESFTSR
jgi:oligoendopeptidase F